MLEELQLRRICFPDIASKGRVLTKGQSQALLKVGWRRPHPTLRAHFGEGPEMKEEWLDDIGIEMTDLRRIWQTREG